MKHLVLFEDDPRFLESFLGRLRSNGGIKLHHFLPEGKFDPKDKHTVESLLYSWIRKEVPQIPDMIVTDRDLSSIYEISISTALVVQLGRQLGVPVCLYARNVRRNLREEAHMNRLRRWSDGFITLDGTQKPEELARSTLQILDGFSEIRASYAKLNKPLPPATFISRLLNEPKLVDRLTLYITGDSNKLTDILSFTDYKKGKDPMAEIRRRIPIVLGYWLWESVLRYPGILLEKIAAASYLNISESEFEDPEVRAIFKSTTYNGPFAGAKPTWYRHKLDELISSGGVNNGNELVAKKLGRQIAKCMCSVDPKRTAGYFCIITNRPVSLECSRGGVAWIPSGADLARVSKPAFDELMPWLGI